MSPALVGSAAVTIPSCRVNLSTASATNESRVFAGVGRKRHRWGASMHLSCALAAASAALLPAGRRSLGSIERGVCRLLANAGWFEVAFPQLASPGPAFVRAPGLSLLRCDCLPEHRCGFVHPPVRIVNHRAVRRTL